MAAQIKCFPVAQHFGIVDELTFGYVERIDQQGAGVPYLQEQFDKLANSKLDLGIAESDVRDELLGLLHAIVTHANDLFDLQLNTLEVCVPALDVCFAYDRQTLNAG
ncbi:MAG: hypothetical protein AAGF25_03995 [Pseudomonadota bacterium]